MTGDKDQAPVVVIAGVGAAGMAIAEQTPAEATLVLIDFDVVERKNLRASPLLTEHGIGQPKVLAVASKLQGARLRPIVPVASPVQSLRAGVFRLAKIAIAAFDNRLADLSWNGFCQAAGVAHMVSVKLEGGSSTTGRLRYFTHGSGFCEQCWWSEAVYAQLASLGRSCATIATGPSITNGTGSQLLAQAVAAEILAPCLACQAPSLAPGSELRVLDNKERLILHARPKEDCLGLHNPVPLAVELTGDVRTYYVGDFIADLDSALGRGWRLPGEMVTSSLAQRAVQVLDAASLAPRSRQRLADLCPAGDLIRVERASGELFWIGLPLGGLLAWLADRNEGGPA
jgi:molybdopterin/thiamine biosynthesis adenylyltransferase